MLRTDPSQPLTIDAPPMSMSVSTALWGRVQSYREGVKSGREGLVNPLAQHTLLSLRMTRSCNLPSDRLILRSQLGTPYSVTTSQLETLTWDGKDE